MVIRGAGGPDNERVLDMREFYRGPYRTAVGEGEMLVEIRIPLSDTSGSAYEKVDRRVGDWAVAAAGARITLSEGNKIKQAGIALAAVGADVTCKHAERFLLGKAPSEKLFASGRQEGGGGMRARHRPARIKGIQAARRRRADTARSGPCGRASHCRAQFDKARREVHEMPVLIGASTGWGVGLVLGVIVVLVAAAIVITIVVLAARIAKQAQTAVAGVEKVREQTDALSGIGRINDSGVRILHSARALRKVAVGK